MTQAGTHTFGFMKFFSICIFLCLWPFTQSMNAQELAAQYTRLEADIVEHNRDSIKVTAKLFFKPLDQKGFIHLALYQAQILSVEEFRLHKLGNSFYRYKNNTLIIPYEPQAPQWHIEVVYQVPIMDNKMVHYDANTEKLNFFNEWTPSNMGYLFPLVQNKAHFYFSLALKAKTDHSVIFEPEVTFLAKDGTHTYYIWEDSKFNWDKKWKISIAPAAVMVALNEEALPIEKENSTIQSPITTELGQIKSEKQTVQEPIIVKEHKQTTVEEKQKSTNKEDIEIAIRTDTLKEGNIALNQEISGKQDHKEATLFNTVQNIKYLQERKKVLQSSPYLIGNDMLDLSFALYPSYEPKNTLFEFNTPQQSLDHVWISDVLYSMADTTTHTYMYNWALWRSAFTRLDYMYQEHEPIQAYLSWQLTKERLADKNLSKNEKSELYGLAVFHMIRYVLNTESSWKNFKSDYLKTKALESEDFITLLSKHLNEKDFEMVEAFLRAKDIEEVEADYSYNRNEGILSLKHTWQKTSVPLHHYKMNYMIFSDDEALNYEFTPSSNPYLRSYNYEKQAQLILPQWEENYPIIFREKRSDVEALYELAQVGQPYNRYRANKHLLQTKNKNLLSTAISWALDDSLQILKSYALQRIDQLDAVGIRKVQDALIREIKRSEPYQRAELYLKAEKMGLTLERPIISTQKGLDLYADLLVMHQYEGRQAIEVAKEAFIEGNTDLALLWFVCLLGDEEDALFVFQQEHEDALLEGFALKALALQAAFKNQKILPQLIEELTIKLPVWEADSVSNFYAKGLIHMIERHKNSFTKEITQSKPFQELMKRKS